MWNVYSVTTIGHSVRIAFCLVLYQYQCESQTAATNGENMENQSNCKQFAGKKFFFHSISTSFSIFSKRILFSKRIASRRFIALAIDIFNGLFYSIDGKRSPQFCIDSFCFRCNSTNSLAEKATKNTINHRWTKQIWNGLRNTLKT